MIDKAGYIVTNYHVVEGAESIQVTFSNNTSIKARLVGSDPSTDIAVLKVDATASALTPLSLGDSDAVQVGDSVVAIGNPFGLNRTVTAGIVSAIQRQITAPNEYEIDHVIQTDAPINHGNSGGPLISARGEVIGVTAQIETGGVHRGQRRRRLRRPLEHRQDRRRSADQERQDRSRCDRHPCPGRHTGRRQSPSRLPVSSGVIVEQVQAGSGAADAGLKAGKTNVTVAGETYKLGGDIIVEADGVPVRDLAGLRDVIAGLKARRHDHAQGVPRRRAEGDGQSQAWTATYNPSG